MKVTILQEKLKEGLAIVEKASGKSLTLPILNNILVTTEKNFLHLSSTDLEIGIRWWALTKIEEEGKITIPARLLSGFVTLLPNDKVSIETQENTLTLQCKNYKTTLKGLSAEEFPLIPKIKEVEHITVDNNAFCASMSLVVDIATPSTTRPEISGVYCRFQKDTLTLAATDSFRLGEKTVPLKTPTAKEYTFILPQKAAKELVNIFAEREGELKVYAAPNQVMFELHMTETEHPHIQFVSRLIDGDYPAYQDIIPKETTTHFTLKKDELLNHVKGASLFSGKISEVKLVVDPEKNTLEVTSQSPEVGEYRSSLEGRGEGDLVTISFNHRFLLDGLLNIKSAEVTLALNGDSGPGVLRPVGDQTYLYVVMPIKAS